MYAQQEKDGLFPATTLLLDVTGTGSFATPLFECSGWSVPSDPLDEPWIRVTIDYPVLIALLTTHVSWNNLEIGCHLRFHRQPDVYDPSVHTLLSFLHL
jgi:UDP-MurNAc hydroxylase